MYKLQFFLHLCAITSRVTVDSTSSQAVLLRTYRRKHLHHFVYNVYNTKFSTLKLICSSYSWKYRDCFWDTVYICYPVTSASPQYYSHLVCGFIET